MNQKMILTYGRIVNQNIYRASLILQAIKGSANFLPIQRIAFGEFKGALELRRELPSQISFITSESGYRVPALKEVLDKVPSKSPGAATNEY
jgi:hypothetical protein